jgi:hypothetical protein
MKLQCGEFPTRLTQISHNDGPRLWPEDPHGQLLPRLMHPEHSKWVAVIGLEKSVDRRDVDCRFGGVQFHA